MVNWFRRRRAHVPVLRLRPRGEDVATTKVDLAELTPDLPAYLGQAAYLQLTLFENLARAIETAPNAAAKAALGHAASVSLTKHRTLIAEIDRRGFSSAELLAAAAPAIDEFQRRTRGADWYENLVTCYVTAGFLDDFFVRLAGGLAFDVRARIAMVYEDASGEPDIAAQLREALADNPRLASRLALWGRRLVGDTMLVARGVLHFSANHASDEARIEPVFTELVAAHTRRMDALGLTA